MMIPLLSEDDLAEWARREVAWSILHDRDYPCPNPACAGRLAMGEEPNGWAHLASCPAPGCGTAVLFALSVPAGAGDAVVVRGPHVERRLEEASAALAAGDRDALPRVLLLQGGERMSLPEWSAACALRDAAPGGVR